MVTAQELAYYFAGTGEAAQALRWVRRAYELSPSGVDARLVESGLFDQVLGTSGFSSELARLRESVWTRLSAASRDRATADPLL